MSLPKPNFILPEDDYRPSRLGKNRPDIQQHEKRFVLYRQYCRLPQPGFYCAYGGAKSMLKSSVLQGHPLPQGRQVFHADHIIPRHREGEHIREDGHAEYMNFQALAGFYNEVGVKGGDLTFHALFQIARQGRTVDGLEFENEASVFLQIFDDRAEQPGAQLYLERLAYGWPWWSRMPDPPYRPILWGYDEQTKRFRSIEESFIPEIQRQTRHVLMFLEDCQSGTLREECRQEYWVAYGCDPEEMINRRL